LQAACQAKEGELAEIHDAVKDEFVFVEAKKQNSKF
jgi:hypothetical protein